MTWWDVQEVEQIGFEVFERIESIMIRGKGKRTTKAHWCGSCGLRESIGKTAKISGCV